MTGAFNLLFGNTTPTSGGVTFVNTLSGNPQFINPAGDDYHIQQGSAAVNSGINANITRDFDGQPRPIGSGFDIGYDEFVLSSLYLPLVMR